MSFSVSVIIPTWNRAETIVSAVVSALAQTRPPLEVLVCDDGSDDDTEARVLALNDPRVRWLPGPRGGCPAIPRNRGIAAARGAWLAFLDSDDAWHPEKLERQMALLQRTGRLAANTDAWMVSPDSALFKTFGRPETVFSFYDFLVFNRLITSSVVVHRSLFPLLEGFPEDLRMTSFEDYALWFRVACLTEIDNIDYPLVNYRDDSAASVRAEAACLDYKTPYMLVLKDFLDWCRRVGSDPLWGDKIRLYERAAHRRLLEYWFTGPS